MPEKILIAQQSVDQRREFCTLLRGNGYLPLVATDLPQASVLLRECPALLMLDVEMSAVDGLAPWASFVHDCQMTNIPCLLFSSNGRPPTQMKQFFPAAAGVILRPTDPGEVVSSVSSQLTIRSLTYELNLTQFQLLEKKRELEDSLHSAANIQQSLIPHALPELDQLRFAARFLPCEKVGGDLYNVLQLDENTVMVYLLDVSGHGVSSAMLTVSVYQSLSLHTGRIIKRVFVGPPYYKILSPAEVLAELDQEYPFERFDMFFTITYVLLDTSSGHVRYSNAGHPPPLLVRANGSQEFLGEGGTIIGMGGVTPFAEGEASLGKGDRLYLYSDGVTEYMNGSGTLFGRERFFQRLVELQGEALDVTCDQILDQLFTFGKGHPTQDDVTLLGIEYLGNG